MRQGQPELAAATKVAIDELFALIAMNTVSRAGADDCLSQIAMRVEDEGASVWLCPFDGGRNLIAHFGDRRPGGLMLAGHVDVVPVTGQSWASDPFEPRSDQGRIVGRGSTDMKGFVACCLALNDEIKATSRCRPVTLCLTPDEETAFRGAKALPEQLRELDIVPGAAIVGEPTEMEIAVRHPGFLDMTTTFHGKAAHASRKDLGVSAIQAAAAFVSHLYELDAQYADAGVQFSVGEMRGGSARNIVAENCTLDWEIRHTSAALGEEVKVALASFQSPNSARRFDQPLVTVPGLSMSKDACPSWLATWIGDRAMSSMPFATEAGIYYGAGIPTLVMGPGSIAQAHRPDEFIEISQLMACLSTLCGLLRHLSKETTERA
ncbi:MAG: M20/M25/M40 family metallo-hydrolase [Paracoccaceae bacterium]|nr:M20/M25/M40 family metallo-hydrolase [Paracoccaceae bacterium]